MNDRVVRSVFSGRPFNQAAYEYLEKGFSPLALPEKKKFPPPTGYTGKSALEADAAQIAEWANSDEYSKGNIGLHLSFVRPAAVVVSEHPNGPPGGDEEGWFDDNGECRYVIVGIDIDEYEDKHGWQTYQNAVNGHGDWEALGELPETWTSSARSNGKAGIRYFLAPAALSYKGGLGSITAKGVVKEYGASVDVIQRAHRFAVVWPSAHPDAEKGTNGAVGAAGAGGSVGQYQWYEPGVDPDGVSFFGGVPCAWDFPVLPSSWVKYLSRDYTPFTVDDIDMDSSLDELDEWAKKTAGQAAGPTRLPEGISIEDAYDRASEVGCSLMRRRLLARCEETMESDDSHNPLIWAHWEFLSMGIKEGHSGWGTAMSVFNLFWARHVFGDGEAQSDGVDTGGKRGHTEAGMEIFRSRSMALRKIKAQVDQYKAEGSNVVAAQCACYEEPEGIFDTDDADGLGEAASRSAKDPGEYEMNDDGNGEHFIDLYEGRFRFVQGYDEWIFWDGKQWKWAKQGLDRRAYRLVKARQQAHAMALLSAALEAKAAEQDDAKAKMQQAQDWMRFSRQSGNNAQARNALEAARENEGISLDSADFDSNVRLLGVSNGLLELNDEGVIFRQAEMDDMVVTNTGVPYHTLDEIYQAGGTMRDGLEEFKAFLKLFQPDVEKREWLQQMMGMCLIAGNPAKKFVFLQGDPHTGKSSFLNLVMAALGEYAGSAEMTIFKGKELNPALAQALPWRVLTTTEAGAVDKSGLDGEMLKRLTGNDPMSAELKGVNTIIRRKPAFVPVVATNNAPHVDGLDEGLRERIEVVPFDVQMMPSEAPVGIEERMTEVALPAILAWLVEGWKMYAQHRLRNRPSSMAEVAAKFQREMSGDIGMFMEDCLEIGLEKDVTERTEAVYQAYKGWTRHQNIQENQVWNKNIFGRRMGKAGYKNKVVKKSDGGTERVYSGLKLRDDLKSVLNFKIQKEK